ncbi:MAG: Phosphoglycolate phosphatase [Myxococcota bacterium]|nr:Phosphoglycolate phosphatase [Myxococcota bacterium]
MLQALIFDCDGVLFETHQANIAFYSAIVDHFGREPLDEREIREVQYLSSHGAIEMLLRNQPGRLQEAFAYARQIASTPEAALRHVRPPSQMREVLHELSRRRRLGVVTNRGPSLHVLLNHFDIAGLFSTAVHIGRVRSPKPDPEGLELALAELGLSAGEAAYIGDSPVDAQAAQAAGVCFIGFGPLMRGQRHHAGDWRQLPGVVEAARLEQGG